MNLSLDRTQAPPSPPFRPVALPPFATLQLSNGMPVRFLQYGAQEVAQLDVLFDAGSYYDTVPARAAYAMRMLTEGAGGKSSEEIARFFDGHGAWLFQSSGGIHTSLSVAGMAAKFETLLPVFAEVWLNPLLPVEEFEEMKKRDVQKLEVNMQKTSWHARTGFLERLYADHPYGHTDMPDEIRALPYPSIAEFQSQFLGPERATLLVTGRFDEGKMLALLEKHFGGLAIRSKAAFPDRSSSPLPSFLPGRINIRVDGVQSTLYLGVPGVGRHHADYYGLNVLSTLLGGYFGSRLMKSVREEKGFTYGIQSGVRARRHGGHFVIMTDVANQYVNATIDAIRDELERLIRETVTAEELGLVKQVMLGNSLSNRETPWQLAETLRFSMYSGISFAEMDRKFEVITHMTPESLQVLAQTYLQPDRLIVSVAGNAEA